MTCRFKLLLRKALPNLAIHFCMASHSDFSCATLVYELSMYQQITTAVTEEDT